MEDKTYDILLVEDNEAHAVLIQRGFRGHSEYKIYHATTFTKAREYLKNNSPDLIISDIRVPDGNGLDFIKENQINENYPVVVMTSYGDETVAVDAIKAGALDYIVKSKETMSGIFKTAKYVIKEWNHLQERKRAEKTIKESEEKFTLFMNHLPAIAFLKDENLRLVFTNRQMDEFFGSEDWIGKTPDEIFPDEYAKNIIADDKTALEKGYIERYERFLNKTGEPHYFFTQKFTLTTPENKTLLGGIAMDISEQKKTQQDLIRAKERAEESDRLKSAFLANMSHEIRTPMNAILGFSQLLEVDNIPEESKKEFVQVITQNTHRLLNLIDDIIDISKLDAGHISVQKDHFDLNVLIKELYKTFCTKEDKKHIQFVIKNGNIPNGAMIYTDRNKLKRVLHNLLSNAFKFTQDGTVELGYQLKNNGKSGHKMLEFYVKDTGIGLSKENQVLIFERFRQVDDSSTRQFGGTGLGLAIAKGFVNLLGGEIWLESEVNKGATFYFTILYEETGNTMTKKKQKSKKSQYNWKDKTFLIVEDDLSSYAYFREILSMTNARLFHAQNGEEAINLCKSKPDIDLVLMDMQLPGINGYEATKEIKLAKPSLPVIAQTANAQSDDRDKCLHAGCNDYITKPVYIRTLLEVIDENLETIDE